MKAKINVQNIGFYDLVLGLTFLLFTSFCALSRKLSSSWTPLYSIGGFSLLRPILILEVFYDFVEDNVAIRP